MPILRTSEFQHREDIETPLAKDGSSLNLGNLSLLLDEIN